MTARPGPMLPLTVWVFIGALALLAATISHEIGHALAARVLGFEDVAIRLAETPVPALVPFFAAMQRGEPAAAAARAAGVGVVRAVLPTAAGLLVTYLTPWVVSAALARLTSSPGRGRGEPRRAPRVAGVAAVAAVGVVAAFRWWSVPLGLGLPADELRVAAVWGLSAGWLSALGFAITAAPAPWLLGRAFRWTLPDERTGWAWWRAWGGEAFMAWASLLLGAWLMRWTLFAAGQAG